MERMFKGRKLLVVDDEQDLREILRDEFLSEGAEVLEAKNGKEALELVKANSFDAVLSDIRMHGGDGVTLAREIKALDSVKPVVFLITGFADVKNWEAYEIGAEGFVTKPFHLDALREAVVKSLTPIHERWTAIPVTAPANSMEMQKSFQDSLAAKEVAFGRGGLFVKLPPRALRIGDGLTLKFSDGRIDGVVRWVRADEQAGFPGGFGLELQYVESKLAQAVAEAIESGSKKAFIPQA